MSAPDPTAGEQARPCPCCGLHIPADPHNRKENDMTSDTYTSPICDCGVSVDEHGSEMDDCPVDAASGERRAR